MSASEKVLFNSAAQLEAYAADLGRMAQVGNVYGLVGDLGAGKTTFVRGFAAGMGIDPAIVSSPTFSLLETYESKAGCNLHHFDVYRMQMALEWYDLGFAETIENGVSVIEWANRVEAVLPPFTKWLCFEYASDGMARTILEADAKEVRKFCANFDH